MFRCQPCFQRQLRHADDGVQRCADLVTHVGEEFRFCSRRSFRPPLGYLELFDELAQPCRVFFQLLLCRLHPPRVTPQLFFGLLAKRDIASRRVHQPLADDGRGGP